MKSSYRSLLIITMMLCAFSASGQDLHSYWSFETVNNRITSEIISNRSDTLEGNFEVSHGVIGQGIRLDGFTTCIRSKNSHQWPTDGEISIEAWIALGNYPWNWCPIITTESNETKGMRLMVGPLGQASIECAIGEQWVCSTSEEDALPLRTWIHIVGVYRANKDLSIYINGELQSTTEIRGSATLPKARFCLGMITNPEKPSDIHRTWGTQAAFFGLDGILDEVKIYPTALEQGQIKRMYTSVSTTTPDIAERKLPTIEKNPRRFGAFYTKLKYYPGWDNLWPVDQDPDIVVCFEKSPIKLVFWRGIRYGASWVSENENWMSDQSVEAWGVGDNDNDGCFEHMQDRHCRFSHVRVIENSDARVVIHWRYAPVSSLDRTWNIDPKTGWECWIDEYYFIYPDGTAIRKVSWKKGSLGYPRQFQETLALLHPGQMVSDLLEKDFVKVADYDGNQSVSSFVEDPGRAPYGPFSWDVTHPFTIQQYQFKSENKPFICFEPGNTMWLRNEKLSSYNRAAGCNHFPVGQARCDGRTTRTSDRPSHCSSFPISDPVIHEQDDRYFWNGFYGMNNMSIDELIQFGRSWSTPPELVLSTEGLKNHGYDRSERCYQIENNQTQGTRIQGKFIASKEHPLLNPAIRIKNWNSDHAKVLINGVEMKDCKTSVVQELEGTDLNIFLFLKAEKDINIAIQPN